MYAIIQTIGNSSILQIPKAFLEALGLRENDRVELSKTNDSITIKKAPAVIHKTLEERLTSFYGKPLDEIDPLDDAELDWGKAKGAEQW